MHEMGFLKHRRTRLVLPLIVVVVATTLLGLNLVSLSPGVIFGGIGAIGGLLVLVEVHTAKRIAQGEFIHGLNSTFIADDKITKLWSKIIHKEKISFEDRILISSYLTFFETIHLLKTRRVIEIALIDDLFRNRFFSAVGNEDVQELALFASTKSFFNIHALLQDWAEYLQTNQISQHSGYHSYLRAALRSKGLKIARLLSEDLDDVLSLQKDISSSLTNRHVLRENSRETFVNCLAKQYVLGIRDSESRLVALGILLDPNLESESIGKMLSTEDGGSSNSMDVKLVMVDKQYRRSGMASLIVVLLEEEAMTRGKHRTFCTIHKSNRASRALFESLGYSKVGRKQMSYGPRLIFSRETRVDRSPIRLRGH